MIPSGRLVVLDTNVLVQLIRGNAIGLALEAAFSLQRRQDRPLISVVTVGELLALAKKFGWGKRKVGSLHGLVRNLVTVQLNLRGVLDKYAELDHYSSRVHTPARTMGKNDVWIAATVAVTNGVLVTTDTDFDHLAGQFIDLVRWDPVAGSVALKTV